MIDLTTIQLNPVAPDIIELQAVNSNLKSENNVFRNILIIAGVGLVLFIGYQLFIKSEEDEN